MNKRASVSGLVKRLQTLMAQLAFQCFDVPEHALLRLLAKEPTGSFS